MKALSTILFTIFSFILYSQNNHQIILDSGILNFNYEPPIIYKKSNLFNKLYSTNISFQNNELYQFLIQQNNVTILNTNKNEDVSNIVTTANFKAVVNNKKNELHYFKKNELNSVGYLTFYKKKLNNSFLIDSFQIKSDSLFKNVSTYFYVTYLNETIFVSLTKDGYLNFFKLNFDEKKILFLKNISLFKDENHIINLFLLSATSYQGIVYNNHHLFMFFDLNGKYYFSKINLQQLRLDFCINFFNNETILMLLKTEKSIFIRTKKTISNVSKYRTYQFYSVDSFNSFLINDITNLLPSTYIPLGFFKLSNNKVLVCDVLNKSNYYIYRPGSLITKKSDFVKITLTDSFKNSFDIYNNRNFLNNPSISNFESFYYNPPKFKPLNKICIGGGGKIPNLSDTSEYERFVWYISDNDSLEGHEVQPVYPEVGKYLLKLKAYSKYGYFSWFSDSVTVTENPEPSFRVEADTGCQFVAFDFENTTDYRGFEPVEVEMLWDFGDGQTSTEINPKHIYKKSGNYTVKLTTSIGSGCKSTFEYPLNIVIKPAPEPKLILSDTVGCSPLTINYSQAVSDEYLSIKHVVNGDTLAIEQGEVTYTEPGEYEITQIVEAENGCRPTITKKITVYRGISPTETIKNTYASYTDSGVLVRWGEVQGAAGYILQYADKDLVTTDWEFLHKTSEKFDYTITAIDSCGNMSQTVKISPINLTGSTDPQNFAANLSWSNYPTPDYCVERLSLDSSWENLGCVSELNFSDEEFADDESFAERCYRVRSVTEPKSYSNVVCLPFVAQLWIPNAFSPNADGINDVWQLKGIGIKEIKVSVYNRWGQLVYEADRLTDSWNGDNAQEGVYLYIVQYQENSGRKRLEKGVLRVLR
jgi:gliding motility-associated-like protein